MAELIMKLVAAGTMFERLQTRWASFKKGVLFQADPNNRGFQIDSYADVAEADDGGSVASNIYGADCYVAFRHDLEEDELEYGVYEGERIAAARVAFTEGGQLGERWAIHESSQAGTAHLEILAEHARDLVCTYYDAQSKPSAGQ